MTTFAAPPFDGGTRAPLRDLPLSVAVWFVLLTIMATALVAVALVAGLLGELAERLAAAGWTAAVRATHPAPPPQPPAPAEQEWAR